MPKSTIDMVAILISVGSLIVSSAAYRSGVVSSEATRRDNDVQRRLQKHASQSDKKSHLVRVLNEYRSLSYLYFVAETANQRNPVPELESRHLEYHRLDAELTSSLEETADSFGPCVRDAVQEMETYLSDVPWEQQIQNDQFHDKIAADKSGREDIGDMINRAIFVDQYDYLTRLIQRRMDVEMVSTETKEESKPVPNALLWPPCDTVPVSMEVSAFPPEVSVGETVTFTAHPKNGPDLYYSYVWSVDEAIKGSRSVLRCSFSQPGLKTANVTTWVFGKLEDAEADRHVLKILFARGSVLVRPR